MIEVQLEDGRTLEIDAPDEASAAAAAKSFLDREWAQKRIEAEDAQRGQVDQLFKNFSDGTTQLAANIPFAGGLVDEGNAFVRSGGGLWGDYDQALAYERERQWQATQRSPTASKINSLAGALGGGAAILKVLPAGASALIPKTAPARILAGGGSGVAGGAVEGFTRGEGSLDNRVAEMPLSMAVGGVAGVGFPVLAKGIGAGYSAAASWLANRGIDAKSINILLDRLKAQGMKPEQAQARIAELGDEAMLADVTPGMQAFMGGTAFADTGAGNIIGQRLVRRREGGGDRMQNVLDEAFGPPKHPYNVVQNEQPVRRADWSSSLHRNREAYEKGRTEVLTNKVSPAEHAADVANYTPEELAMSKAGMRYDIDRRLSNIRNNPDMAADRVLLRDNNMEKVHFSIGSDKSRNLQRGIDREGIFNDTSSLGEPARLLRMEGTNAARDFWGANARPGVVGDMIAAGLATSATTGSLLAGTKAAADAGTNRLRHAIGATLTPKASPALIQKTAENLTAQRGDLRGLARLLVDKAQELPKRSEAARNIEKIVRLLLSTQAGRVGFESQHLIAGGPR